MSQRLWFLGKGCAFVKSTYRRRKVFGLLLIGYLCAQSQAATTNILDINSTNKARVNLFADRMVARGKGFEITRSQVEDAFTAYKASAATQGQTIPESRRAEVETQVLDRLINVQVLMTKATDADRVKAKAAGETDFGEYVKRVPDEADFRRRILSFGMTVDQFKGRLVEEALFREVIDHEIRSKIAISTEQARQFYTKNDTQYDEPEKVRASHIVLLTEDPQTHVAFSDVQKQEKKQQAEKILARLKAGEDFAKLAKECSEDPNTRDKGGELPLPFARGKLMVAEIDQAAFALSTNQISDVVQTKAGYHIIKVSEKIPARHIPFEEVESKIKEYLSVEETQKQLPAYLQKLRSETNVEILEPAKR
jgi:hypothetical protein